jgi:hypothetical protein
MSVCVELSYRSEKYWPAWNDRRDTWGPRPVGLTPRRPAPCLGMSTRRPCTRGSAVEATEGGQLGGLGPGRERSGPIPHLPTAPALRGQPTAGQGRRPAAAGGIRCRRRWSGCRPKTRVGGEVGEGQLVGATRWRGTPAGLADEGAARLPGWDDGWLQATVASRPLAAEDLTPSMCIGSHARVRLVDHVSHTWDSVR